MKQHTRSENSGIYQHIMEERHKFDPMSTVSIIDCEPRWFERGVREAIHERMEQPEMNKTGGICFTLSHAWDRAITAFPRHTQTVKTAITHASTSHPINNSQSADDSHVGMTETSNF